MSVIIGGPAGLNMLSPTLDTMDGVAITSRTTTSFEFDLGNVQHVILSGTEFTYDSSGKLAGGVITGAHETDHGQLVFDASSFSISVQDLASKMAQNASDFFFYIGADGETVTAADVSGNVLAATAGPCSIVGGALDDEIQGNQGADTLEGGAGNDFITSYTQSFGISHGGSGDDTIIGSAAGQDLINGNQGNDSIDGWGGNDTLLGGQGDDVIDAGNRGQSADALLNGNLGNDTLSSVGDGLLHGGHDTLRGGAGRRFHHRQPRRRMDLGRSGLKYDHRGRRRGHLSR